MFTVEDLMIRKICMRFIDSYQARLRPTANGGEKAMTGRGKGNTFHFPWRSILLIALLSPVLPLEDKGKDEGNPAQPGISSAERQQARNRMVFVAVGSDDWGRWTSVTPVWPDESEFHEALRGGHWPHAPTAPETAETLEDIDVMRGMLRKINEGVSLRQRVTLTPYVIVGGPDYEAMRVAGCPDGPGCSYREMLYPRSPGGLSKPPYSRGDLRDSYMDLYRERLWHPQYHGRSHFDINAWVRSIKGGDKLARYYFSRGMAFVDPHHNSSSGGEYIAGDSRHSRSVGELKEWIEGGLSAFREWWGYNATMTAVPVHHADTATAKALDGSGLSMEWPITSELRFEQEHAHIIPRFDIDVCDEFRVFRSLKAVSDLAELQKKVITEYLESNDYLSLQWHASNVIMQSSLRAKPGAKYVQEEHLPEMISHIRSTFPGAIFVTVAELGQIMQAGISLISWGPSSLLFRNYNFSPREWKLPEPPEGVDGGWLNCEFEWGGIVRYRVWVSRGDTATVGGMCECELKWGGGKSNAGNDREKTTTERGSVPSEEPKRGGSFEREEANQREPLEVSGSCQGGDGGKCNVEKVNANVGKVEAESTQPTEAEILYFWRTHANASESARFRAMLDAGRIEQVVKEVSALRASVIAAQEEEHRRICVRCTICSTCSPSQLPPLPDLPFLEMQTDFSDGDWRDKTCRRPNRGVDDVSISMFVDGTSIEVYTSGYDFVSSDGYAVIATGGKQIGAWKPLGDNGPFRMSMQQPSDSQGHFSGILYACLMRGNGRPMGVCQVDMMPSDDGKSPSIISGVNATRHHSPTMLPWEDIAGALSIAPSAPALRAPQGRRVAFVLTACVAMGGRMTLLEETVLTFLASNTYPIDRYVLVDDSGDPAVHARLVAMFGKTFHILVNARARTGQMFSIDAAYAVALEGGADYVFHCQDDWRFHTKGDFVSDSLRLLEDVPDAMVVWCRDADDHGLPLGVEEVSKSGVPYRLVIPTQKWKGFTFNPGLRRVSDYFEMAPMQRFWYEDFVQGYMRWMGMHGVSLTSGWVVHTGDNYSTKPSYQWANSQFAMAEHVSHRH